MAFSLAMGGGATHDLSFAIRMVVFPVAALCNRPFLVSGGTIYFRSIAKLVAVSERRALRRKAGALQ
jgi:hypothetical protein